MTITSARIRAACAKLPTALNYVLAIIVLVMSGVLLTWGVLMIASPSPVTYAFGFIVFFGGAVGAWMECSYLSAHYNKTKMLQENRPPRDL